MNRSESATIISVVPGPNSIRVQRESGGELFLDPRDYVQSGDTEEDQAPPTRYGTRIMIEESEFPVCTSRPRRSGTVKPRPSNSKTPHQGNSLMRRFIFSTLSQFQRLEDSIKLRQCLCVCRIKRLQINNIH